MCSKAGTVKRRKVQRMESDDSYHFCLYPILDGINKKFTLLVCILMVIVVGGEAELVNEPT